MSFNPTPSIPILIFKRRRHHTHVPRLNMSDPGPDRPRLYGPHTQSVYDVLFPTPSLVYFLNNRLERVTVRRLRPEHWTCTLCNKCMCDEMHPVLTPTLWRPPIPLPPSLPPRAPTTICTQRRPPNRLSARGQYVNGPGMPSAPPPPIGEDVCPDRTNCELAIRVATEKCGHVFGSRCLLKVLASGQLKCPLCQTVWLKGLDHETTASRKVRD
ncbi:hypothetical protein EK21DRAFT_85369 [Setomelanomma holmii]|uniref:RING-type domain-containing protein n=1 Tax=Setomelanomma holmii TaxID=210430 RepID=A0A9P4LRG2_9PLEO|nr:hypothetical protein EK21DRAFT_85369 [Setomelanomma holmii]